MHLNLKVVVLLRSMLRDGSSRPGDNLNLRVVDVRGGECRSGNRSRPG